MTTTGSSRRARKSTGSKAGRAATRRTSAATNGHAGAAAASLDLDADVGATITLQAFLATAEALTLDERRQVVEQALVLIDELYVHLPLKRAMHAVDPVQRMKLLRHRLDAMTDRRFHDEMISIFTELRDLHTNYILPDPYRGKIAFLPFLMEEFFEGGNRQYLVSKMRQGFGDASFKPGVVVTHWNGVPIDRAVELNAQRQAGSNPDARHARGLNTMTTRPMALTAPPDEEWVVVGYLADDGQEREIRIDWRVFVPDPSPTGVNPDSADDPTARALGIDTLTEAVRRVKKILFVPQAMEVERQVALLGTQGAFEPGGGGLSPELADVSVMPDVLAFRTVTTPHGDFGYIRIWTFNVRNVDAFIEEVVRIAGLLPQNGLIVDVRGNGGGVIMAGERLLQLLTPRAVEPERLQFINTPLTLALCHSDRSLEPWAPSVEQSVETGATYSDGFTIEPVASSNALGQRYQGPVVLITDALIYSTTDIFTAGFQDHGIGPILGVHGNTGAGGANVWTHDLLRQLLPGQNSPLQPLPKNTSMRVAIRRTIRVGNRAGVPVEDLGVLPDRIHHMTRNDLLNNNQDLIDEAADLLAGMPVRALSAVMAPPSGGMVEVRATTKGLSRLDASVDGRPRATADVVDGTTTFNLPTPPSGAQVLELRGFDGGQLVAARRYTL
jgi:hypothetical protein